MKVMHSCLCVGMIGVSVLEDKTLFCEDTYLLLVSHSCLRLRHICMGWSGPVLVISAPGPRAPCNIFNPTRYTRLGIKCSSGLNSYARMPDNQQLKPLWRTAYYPHYTFIILLPTYYQSVCNGVISVGSDICLLFHCCS